MAIPGLQRLDHIGLTVPDLDEAHRFFVDVLGCEYLYSLGPFAADDDWMTEHLAVHPPAEHRLLLDAMARGDGVDAEQHLAGHIRRTRVELSHHPEVYD